MKYQTSPKMVSIILVIFTACSNESEAMVQKLNEEFGRK